MGASPDKINELNRILERLKQEHLKLKDVYLFGSYLKGGNYGDIDVALVSDDFTGIRFYDIEKLALILKRYPPEFDFHLFTTESFYDTDNFFAQEIQSSGQKYPF